MNTDTCNDWCDGSPSLLLLHNHKDTAPAELSRQRLALAGYRVAMAATVEQGLRRLAQGSYEAIILDYQPLGRDVPSSFAQAAPTTPIIVATDPDDFAACRGASRTGNVDCLIRDPANRYLDLFPAMVDQALVRRRALAERERVLRFATVTLNAIDDAVIATDETGRITSLNPAAAALCGCDESESVGRPITEVLRVGDGKSADDGFTDYPVGEVLRSGGVRRVREATVLCALTGRKVPVDYSAAPIRDGDEHVIGAVVVLQDATRRRVAEQTLELFANVFSHTSEAVMITDRDSRIVDVNAAFCEITGYAREEVLGRNPSMMKSGRHGPEFFLDMWRSLRESGRWQGEIWDRRKNGEVFPKRLSVNAVQDLHGHATHYVGIFSDITSVKKTEERLSYLAHYDALTGLPNRLLFHDRLQQAIRYAARFGKLVAVMFLDLDRFKEINDSLGHKAGDDLLTEAARRLQDRIRNSDTVARLAGDEFTAVLQDITRPDDAAVVADKILEAFDDPFMLEGREVYTSVSIGLSLFPIAGGTADALIKAADQAMYRAKEQGGKRYFFYRAGIERYAHERLALNNDLRRGLVREEFLLYYQPQYALPTGRVVGVEALLRWDHPERGLLAPEEFLALAEDTGAILQIGEWVLNTACRRLAALREAGHTELNMAVNISPRQLAQPDFVAAVQRALHESGIPPARLELEITESVIIHDYKDIEARLKELDRLGIVLSVDDFGNGYSSMTYLQRSPVAALKIDRTFIGSVTDKDGSDAAILRAIISLAERLGLKVVAEGVETAEQLAFLLAEQCTNAQGYYFNRPVPERELEQLLAGQGTEVAKVECRPG